MRVKFLSLIVFFSVVLLGAVFATDSASAFSPINAGTVKSGVINISWPAQANMVYRVYYKKTGDENYILKGKTASLRQNNDFNYEITGLESGSAYQVKAEECDLNETVCVEGLVPGFVYVNPETPSFTAVSTSNSVALTINSVIGATQYQVCRKGNSGNFVGSLGSDLEYTFNVTPNTVYNYKVRACNSTIALNAQTDCETDLNGCSKFSSLKKIQTEKITSLVDAKALYTNLNGSYLKRISQYEASFSKLTLLSDAVKADYSEELNQAETDFNSKLAIVNGLTSSDDVQLKYLELKSSGLVLVNNLRSKLQIYTRINSYYYNLDKFFAKVKDTNPFREGFNSAITKAKEELAKEEVKTENFTLTNSDGLKAEYKNISSFSWYKYMSLVYQKLNYFDSLAARIYSLKEMVLQDAKGKFNSIPQPIKTIYAGLTDQELAIYKSARFFVPTDWVNLSKYTNFTVYNRYKDLKSYNGYKKLSTIASGLNRINQMQNTVSVYKTRVASSSDADLLEKSTEFYNTISADLVNGDANSNLAARIVSADFDPFAIYKSEIMPYNKYKIYAYYTQGAQALNQIIQNTNNSQNGLDSLLVLAGDVINGNASIDECRNINTATLHVSLDSAEAKLLSLSLSDYDGSRNKYNKEIKAQIQKAKDDFGVVSDKLDSCLAAVEAAD
jgi:hypothetical protein